MFDELIIPAARLLDTVESRINDYQTTHGKPQEVYQSEDIKQLNQTTEKPKKITMPFRPPKMNTPIINPPKLTQIKSLPDFKTAVFEEHDVIDWGSHAHYKDQQAKQVELRCRSESQAEEEAETDEEMIEYGRKVANKAVRVAIQTIKSRDWSLRSRMEHYKQSVRRLKEANRRRGR